MSLNQSFSWLFSSNALLGAQNKSADGSTFTASLQEPFQIPPNAYSVSVEVNSATVWFNTFNVVAGANLLRFRRVTPATFTSIIIPPGLYSFDQLNAEIVRLLSYRRDELQSDS